MISTHVILASAESLSVATTLPTSKWMSPNASEVTFLIDVQSATGTGTLTAKVQSVMPHTTGNQYLNERVFDLDATQKVNLTIEAEDWPSPVCTQASSFPVTVQRTYVGFGMGLRLVLTPTGTLVPVVSVVAVTKG